MKVITVYQPTAAAIALGVKRMETRGWPTKYRGPLAIHASVDMKVAQQMVKARPDVWARALADLRVDASGAGSIVSSLAFGAVVAVVQLVDCVPTADLGHYERDVGELERALGDFTPGRFAWVLRSARLLAVPVKAKGQQGLWTLPPAVAKQVEMEVAAYRAAHPSTRLDPRQPWPFKGGR